MITESLVFDILIITEKVADILKTYHKNLNTLKVREKNDLSPVTEADLKAHQIIIESLKQLTPEIPILSEELNPMPLFEERKKWATYWLIDPLDGTKSFLKGETDFAISVALIKNHQPILGVIELPMLDQCYFAFKNQGAYKINREINKQKQMPQKISVNKNYDQTFKITIGKAKALSDRLKERLEKLNDYKIIYHASAYKFCLVSEGVADLYLRLYPTHQWDTAAGDCILSEAGGAIICLENQKKLCYNKSSSLINPYFLAGPKWAIEHILNVLI